MSLGLAARRGAGDLGHFWTRSTLPEALRSEASRLTLFIDGEAGRSAVYVWAGNWRTVFVLTNG